MLPAPTGFENGLYCSAGPQLTLEVCLLESMMLPSPGQQQTCPRRSSTDLQRLEPESQQGQTRNTLASLPARLRPAFGNLTRVLLHDHLPSLLCFSPFFLRTHTLGQTLRAGGCLPRSSQIFPPAGTNCAELQGPVFDFAAGNPTANSWPFGRGVPKEVAREVFVVGVAVFLIRPQPLFDRSVFLLLLPEESQGLPESASASALWARKSKIATLTTRKHRFHETQRRCVKA